MVQVLDTMDYSDEVPHSDHLVVQGTEPFNAEPTAAALVEFPITPDELVYCRNHGPVLDLDESTYTINVHGLQGSRAFTLEELRGSFPRVEVVSALQVCDSLWLWGTPARNVQQWRSSRADLHGSLRALGPLHATTCAS